MLGTLLDFLFPPRGGEWLLRAEREDGLLRYMEPVVTEAGVTALLPYDEPLVRAAVVETKFHGNERAARMLSIVLAAYLQDELRERSAYEDRTCVLVPVPLSQARFRERGYNQAEVIARYASSALGLALDTELLVRTRDTTPQTSLGGTARRRNLRGAFSLTRAPDPAHLYMVIDDVTTTGSTLCEAAAAFDSAVTLALAQSNGGDGGIRTHEGFYPLPR